MPYLSLSIKKLLLIFVSLLFMFMLIFFNIHSFLSPHKPIAEAKILVVDAWLSDRELGEAAAVYRNGNYSRVIIPGSIMERSLFFPGMEGAGDVAAVVLMYKGVPYDKITPLLVNHVQKDRTYQAALTTQKWLDDNKISPSGINLFTGCAHARRSWSLYKKVFKHNREVGIISATPVGYNARRWWQSSNGFRTVIDETVAYLYVLLFFHPDF